MYLQVAHVVIHVGVLVGAIDAHPQVAIAQAADGDTLVQGMRAPTSTPGMVRSRSLIWSAWRMVMASSPGSTDEARTWVAQTTTLQFLPALRPVAVGN